MKLLSLSLVCAAASFAQQPLTISTTSFPPGSVGSAYSAVVTASGGTTPYTWSVQTGSQLPPGLALTAAGIILGTPTTSGNFNFTLAVVDARSASAARGFSITIAGSTAKLSITTNSPLPPGTAGQPYSLTLTAIGGTPSSYRWTITQGALPAGLALSTAGVISGTPTAITTTPATFQVQVAETIQTATAALSLSINPLPLSITTVPPLFTGTVGSAYAQTFSAVGGRPPYTWSLSGNAGGLTLDATRGVLSGTPQTAGTFTFSVEVADSALARTSQTFSVTVNPPTLAIGLGTTVSGKAGVFYSQTLPVSAIGGTPPITWSIVAGSVPGLSFEPSTRILSGTPSDAGSFNLTVQAADSAGLTASRSLTIVIAPPDLSISTARQLPGVGLNSPYSIKLDAVGGTPPYTWSANGLPGGLSLDPSTGLIAGTASEAGSFAPAITVRDSVQATATDRFTINVTLPATPAITFTGLPGTIPPKQQFPLTLAIGSSFPAPIAGTAFLTFSPDSGPPDSTVVFASGLRTVNFRVAAGSTTVELDDPLMLQTGTVSGTITVTLRLLAGGLDITPAPAPTLTGQVRRAAPVIGDVQFTRSGSGLSFTITGYSTSREITQAVFNFNASSGQTLQPSASSITIDVGNLFNTWFQSPANSAYGSQFVLTQPFTVQGDANSVIPASVTLTNRDGSTTFSIRP